VLGITKKQTIPLSKLSPVKQKFHALSSSMKNGQSLIARVFRGKKNVLIVQIILQANNFAWW